MIFLTIVFMAGAVFGFIGICICIAEGDILGVLLSMLLLFFGLQFTDDTLPWN